MKVNRLALPLANCGPCKAVPQGTVYCYTALKVNSCRYQLLSLPWYIPWSHHCAVSGRYFSNGIASRSRKSLYGLHVWHIAAAVATPQAC